MRVPAGLTEFPSPTETLTIEGEVFGDPQDRIRSTAELVRSEGLRKSPGVAAETEATLAPRVGPQKLFVVIDLFPEEGSDVAGTVHPLKGHIVTRLLNTVLRWSLSIFLPQSLSNRVTFIPLSPM